jgi:hypothetical protein
MKVSLPQCGSQGSASSDQPKALMMSRLRMSSRIKMCIAATEYRLLYILKSGYSSANHIQQCS